MSVKIRLFRVGRKKKSIYRIVVIDSRKRRDGRYLDKIGFYDPLKNPAEVRIDKEKALQWLDKGAQPSDTVFNLFQKEGIALEYHLIKNNVSEEARHIELQKWELSKKEKAAGKKVEVKTEEKVDVKAEEQAEETAAVETEVKAEEQAEEKTAVKTEKKSEEKAEVKVEETKPTEAEKSPETEKEVVEPEENSVAEKKQESEEKSEKSENKES